MQAKTPRPCNASVLRSPRRARERERNGELVARLQRVVAAEVGRLAHLGHRVAVGAAAFADDDRYQRAHLRLERIRCALEDCGPLRRGPDRPLLECGRRALERGIELGGRCLREGADDAGKVPRLAHPLRGRGRRGPRRITIGLRQRRELLELVAAREVDAKRIRAPR
jgi:hypothetical protein